MSRYDADLMLDHFQISLFTSLRSKGVVKTYQLKEVLQKKDHHLMQSLHHVAVTVTDINKALEWYQAEFDVETAYRDESWALLHFDNIALALVLPEQHPPHIAVESDKAESYGPLTPHRDGTASVYIQDPWGNAIEIIKRTL
jgi:catechol-2,3-dioxygenase